MALILTDAGATQIARSFFNKVNPTAGNDLTLKLFVNNVTPVDTHTAANYTEAEGGGYAAKTLTAASFTVSTVNNIVQAAYELQQFAFTGALTTNTTVYGAYIVDADGVLICADRAPASYVPAAGSIFAVAPIIQISKGTPT